MHIVKLEALGGVALPYVLYGRSGQVIGAFAHKVDAVVSMEALRFKWAISAAMEDGADADSDPK